MSGRTTASAVVIRAVRDVPAFRKGLWVTLVLIAVGTVAQLVVPLFLQRLTDSGALSESATADIYRSGAIALAIPGASVMSGPFRMVAKIRSKGPARIARP